MGKFLPLAIQYRAAIALAILYSSPCVYKE